LAAVARAAILSVSVAADILRPEALRTAKLREAENPSTPAERAVAAIASMENFMVSVLVA
jgi:hypothetical protein